MNRTRGSVAGVADSRVAIGVVSCARISGQVISLTLAFALAPSSIEAVICATISS